MNTPDQYDTACGISVMLCGGKAAVLIILGGHAGDGFAAHCAPELIPNLPTVLRVLAQDIEDSPDKVTRLFDVLKEATTKRDHP